MITYPLYEKVLVGWSLGPFIPQNSDYFSKWTRLGTKRRMA